MAEFASIDPLALAAMDPSFLTRTTSNTEHTSNTDRQEPHEEMHSPPKEEVNELSPASTRSLRSTASRSSLRSIKSTASSMRKGVKTVLDGSKRALKATGRAFKQEVSGMGMVYIWPGM